MDTCREGDASRSSAIQFAYVRFVYLCALCVASRFRAQRSKPVRHFRIHGALDAAAGSRSAELDVMFVQQILSHER